jgi:serine/threonine protein phosphatase PrpC
MRGKMDCYGLTNTGQKRPENEDQFLIADLNKSMLIHQTSLSHEDHTRLFGGSQGKLLLVADGMGGHADGQRASALAVQTLSNYVLNTMPWFYRLPECPGADMEEELKSALEECQRQVESAGEVEPSRRKMGTTLTLAYLLWPRLYVVHAGDSRCYLLRQSRLEQITHDHTVAQQMVDRGALNPADVEGSRFSHMLWNCIGGGSHDLNPDVYKAGLKIGDTLLLCSDGLSKVVSPADIREVLARPISAEAACEELVTRANAAGGPDNITVVVAHFRDTPTTEQAARERAAEVEETTEEIPVIAGDGAAASTSVNVA